MTVQGEQSSSSDFLLPELSAIGDTVCHMLQLGVEEELLGEAILTRVHGLITQGRVTAADVVRLALLTDALRVAEEAITADGEISEAEVRYALPLVQAAARRLAAFREYYAHLREASLEHVREFVETHAPDTQLFGGSCDDSSWLGLEIVRRVAQETGDREALERYSELMLRLAEEIIALEGTRAPVGRVRRELEARLGLRKLLAQAEESVAEDAQDPRLRVFCSPEAPEVFHAVAHANQVWRRDPLDVELVHQDTRNLFTRLLARATEQTDHGTGRILLVLGEAGSGKTHLMRAFRERVHSHRTGYVGYMQMSSAPDDYARYALINLLESLEKPYDDPGVQDSGLMCLSDALLMAPASISPERRRRLREDELSDDELCSLVFELADEVVSDPRFQDLDLDMLRAFLFLQRREPPLYARVLKYLRCEPLGKRDMAMLGDLAPRIHADDALRVVTHLGKLISRVEGGALVLLLDQLEDIFGQDRARERFVRVLDLVRHMGDHVPNAVIVLSCLRDFYFEMKQYVTKSVLDRVERDPEPQQLRVDRSLEEIEVIVERRLAHLYESQGVRQRSDQPFYPFSKSFLERLVRLSTRDVLSELQQFQSRCIAAGGLLEEAQTDPVVRPNTVQPPPALPIAQRWIEFRAAESARIEVPDDDAELLEVLRATLLAANDELPEGVQIKVERDAAGLMVVTPDRGEGPLSSLVCLTNKSYRGGGLTRQLEALISAVRGTPKAPVAVRCSDFGGGPGSAVAKHLATLIRAHGRKLVVDNGDWRTLVAYRSFWAQHHDSPGYVAWARSERPLLSLDAVRGILGLPSLAANTVDVFVTTQPQSPVHKASALPPAKSATRPPALPSVELKRVVTVCDPANTQNSGPLHIGVTISVNAKPAHLEPELLKRHAAFLGASGSGKTSLALNVIEQLVARGIGAVLLDRKGDLATYADPAVWTQTDPDRERERRKRELFAQAHIRLFTPGNPSGRSMRIRAVPEGLGGLPSHERAQIAQFAAQGLGAMMGYKGTSTELTNLAILAKTIDVMGQLCGDKEVRLPQLIELLAEQDENLIVEVGHLDPRLFKKLVTHLETLRLNHGALLESKDEPLRAEVLLGMDGSIPQGKVPITIISTKFLGDAERVDFWVSQMLVELSRWCSRSPAKHLQSVLFLDEADAYMPASSKPATKEPLQDLLKRARSAGLGVMLATQNPGDLDYKGRDNIGTWWLGRIGSKTAIEKMKPLLSECRTDVSGSLATASVGEFFQVTDGSVVRIRSERALTDIVQQSEQRILELAEAGGARRKVG